MDPVAMPLTMNGRYSFIRCHALGARMRSRRPPFRYGGAMAPDRVAVRDHGDGHAEGQSGVSPSGAIVLPSLMPTTKAHGCPPNGTGLPAVKVILLGTRPPRSSFLMLFRPAMTSARVGFAPALASALRISSRPTQV